MNFHLSTTDDMTKHDDPAAPVVAAEPSVWYVSPGLTKREHFAAMMLQGLLACSAVTGARDDLANESVRYADALIAALKPIPTPATGEAA